jgi:acyl-CoA thioesterase-1
VDRVRRPGTTGPAGLVVALLLALSGCGGGDDPAAAPSPSASTGAPSPSASSSVSWPVVAAAARVYVAVGASETAGVGADHPRTQAWPRVLHDRALPGTRLVNLGVPGATVRDGLTEQLPRALAADPDVVTVWLAVNDVLSLVPVTDYEATLRSLVHALRRGGRTEVLVGNVPPLDRLPAYRTCLPGSQVPGVSCVLPLVPAPRQVRALVGEYNAAVARVVAAEGAVAVDLSGDPGRSLSVLTADDGFHPSTRGHRVIAAAFARAVRND